MAVIHPCVQCHCQARHCFFECILSSAAQRTPSHASMCRRAGLHTRAGLISGAWLNSWSWLRTRAGVRCHACARLRLWLRDALCGRLGPGGYALCAVWSASGRSQAGGQKAAGRYFCMPCLDCLLPGSSALPCHDSPESLLLLQPCSLRKASRRRGSHVVAGASIKPVRGVCKGVQHVCDR